MTEQEDEAVPCDKILGAMALGVEQFDTPTGFLRAASQRQARAMGRHGRGTRSASARSSPCSRPATNVSGPS